MNEEEWKVLMFGWLLVSTILTMASIAGILVISMEMGKIRSNLSRLNKL